MLQQQGLMMGSPQEETPPQGWLLSPCQDPAHNHLHVPQRRDGSIPARHDAGGGRSCVTVGGHFPASSGPQQR